MGFAAETRNVNEYAQGKLKNKKLDMIVANDVSDTTIGFSSDANEVTVLTHDGQEALPKASKKVVARKLMYIASCHYHANHHNNSQNRKRDQA